MQMRTRILHVLMIGLVIGLMAPAFGQGEVSDYRPVSDEELRSPADGDWLMWRRTYDAWGYSPLDQINTDNVENLELAWAWTMPNGRQETTPLVRDGVMYLHNFGDIVQALDAATGDLIWEYARSVPSELEGDSAVMSRSMALAGDKLYFAAGDGAMVALDAATGQVEWESGIANWELGHKVTGGPIVADGVVVTGMSGCGGAQPGGCYIVGLDAETGENLWRTWTIARPDTPEGDTWNGLPLESRFGSSAWNIGSYDPELDLVYWSTGQPYPWIAEMSGLSPREEGEDNSALYTDTTLAMDPQTGEIEWYHQWLPNDTWDLDYAYEQMLIDLEVDGETRPALVATGKLGIVEAIDRETGEWLWAHETAYQNVVDSIDPDTGEKTINPDSIPHVGETTVNCPADPGARSWASTAYSPLTNMLYIPGQEFCSDTTPNPLEPGEVYTGGGRATFDRRPIPDSDGNMGFVEAVDLGAQDTSWEHRMRPANGGSAALTTGGGLVFTGNLNRYVFALDGETGEKLWEQRLNNVPNGYPVTYTADGTQYVAVPVGFGSGPSRAFSVLTPEIVNPPGGSSLWVFALPND